MSHVIVTEKNDDFYEWEAKGARKYRWIGRSAEMEVALDGHNDKDSVGIATINVGVVCKNKIRILCGATVLHEAELSQGWRMLRFEIDLSVSRWLKFEVENAHREGARTLGVMLEKLNWVPIRKYQLHFIEPDISICNRGEFNIQLSKGVIDSGAYLVLDIYDLDNPVHPDGHIGWWQFPAKDLGHRIKGSIKVKNKRVEISLDKLTPTAQWVNPSQIPVGRLVVNAVLRDSITNAIIYMDKVPAFQNAKDLSKLRATFAREDNVPQYTPAGFVLKENCTIRLVSPNLFLRDAVGNLCLDIYRMLRQNDIPVGMYAENCDFAINDIVRRINRIDDDSSYSDLLLYFSSTYDPYLEDLLAIPFDRRVAYFHGITKHKLLQVFEPELSVACRKGLDQIRLLQEFDLIATNSKASAQILVGRLDPDCGWKQDDIHVIPPRIISAHSVKNNEPKKRNKNTRILFVGRLKSHKKIDHLLELFSAYLRLDVEAELSIVGGGADKAYWDYLKWLETSQLKIPGNKVKWVGSISDAELEHQYLSASVFITMSEDEGFCLPVFEAMLAGVPVFAYGLPAIIEVMQGTGIYFNTKDYDYLATCIYELLNNSSRKNSIVAKQKRRALELAKDMNGQGFLNLLQPLMD